MMLDQITGLGQTQDTTSTKKTEALQGEETFLKMFMAQMKYQDPLSPMDSSQFTAQLAQFSSLEQLFTVNQNLESIKASQGQAGQFDALLFIGKEITADGSSLSLDAGETASGAFQVAGSGECTVMVLDAQGNLIRQIPLGYMEGGEHHFEWDGLDESGNQRAPGIYGFKVLARGDQGQSLSVETMITGQVDKVALEGASPVLYVGGIPVALSQVKGISSPGPVSVEPGQNVVEDDALEPTT
jgi:flagellar basal-body rod modification protein FlgD